MLFTNSGLNYVLIVIGELHIASTRMYKGSKSTEKITCIENLIYRMTKLGKTGTHQIQKDGPMNKKNL